MPAWAWSSSEWAAITRASPQTQRPLLQRALRNLRNEIDPEASDDQRLAVELRTHVDIWTVMRSDMAGHMSYGKYKGFTLVLEDMREVFAEFSSQPGVAEVLRQIEDMRMRHDSSRQYGDNPYVTTEVQQLIDTLQLAYAATGVDLGLGRFTEDMPVKFDPDDMPPHIEALLRTPDFRRDAGYAGSFMTRVKGLVGDLRLRPMIKLETDESLADWLTKFLGDTECSNGEIAVVDLSMLASEVVQTVVAVIGLAGPRELVHGEREPFIGGYKRQRSGSGVGSRGWLDALWSRQFD